MAHCCLGGLAEFLQRYGGLGGKGAGLVWRWGIWTREPAERGEMKVNQVRVGRGASVGITGFAGLSAQPGTLIQRRSICLPSSLSPPTSFQQRVERFHENPGVRELLPDT